MQINLVNRDIDYLVEGTQGWKDGNLMQAIRERELDVKLPWPPSVEFQIIPGWFLVTMLKAGFSPLSCIPYVVEEEVADEAQFRLIKLVDLDFGAVPTKALVEAGYTTLADLYLTDKVVIGEIPGVGPKTMEAVERAFVNARSPGEEVPEETEVEKAPDESDKPSGDNRPWWKKKMDISVEPEEVAADPETVAELKTVLADMDLPVGGNQTELKARYEKALSIGEYEEGQSEEEAHEKYDLDDFRQTLEGEAEKTGPEILAGLKVKRAGGLKDAITTGAEEADEPAPEQPEEEAPDA